MSIMIRSAVVLACASVVWTANARGHDDKHRGSQQFERVATFIVCENTSCDRDVVELTAAEIVAASADGKTLIYTDSPNTALGLIDIRDRSRPRALGAVALDGEPTSVAVA